MQSKFFFFDFVQCFCSVGKILFCFISFLFKFIFLDHFKCLRLRLFFLLCDEFLKAYLYDEYVAVLFAVNRESKKNQT